MATATKQSRAERIAQHGRNLLALFPHAAEQDPVKLCKKLRRLELQGNELALRLCNGPEFAGGYDEVDKFAEAIVLKVNTLLGNRPSMAGESYVPIFLNRDPRGYALKIRSEWMESRRGTVALHRDWGGYGILAPEID